ncbi:MAG: NADH-quinone oxidoreductase subunit N, partial [Planctomycetota bacterium]
MTGMAPHDLISLAPEFAMLLGAMACLVAGLANPEAGRKAAPWLAATALFCATVLTIDWNGTDVEVGVIDGPVLFTYGVGGFAGYVKLAVCFVGIVLLMVAAAVPDQLGQVVAADSRKTFEAGDSLRGEFFAFFLFSLTGVMLCAGANDLIWLFLALELTSLPTYVMVVISTRGTRSQESGVKYFFLGALGAAIFLMGFALIFGGTGSTMLFGTPGDPGIAEILAYQRLQFNGINPIAMAGLVLAVIGIGFKIAAVPMHFYTADVYQGASSTVAAFLAFVPKTAGFIALIVLLGTVGWSHDTFAGEGGQLPGVLRTVLWVMAVMTMFAGNILALVQTSAKRMLAYSSIAHSGYMLVGLIAGPGDGTFRNNGIAAVLFYLTAYGVMNLGAFAVIACLEKANRDSESGDEPEDVADLKGLCKTHPVLGWSMVLCAISLLGMPPLLGFWGKLPLFTAGIGAGEIVLVVILG